MKKLYKQLFLTFSLVLAGFAAFAQPTFEINNIKDPCDGLQNGSFEVLVTAGEPTFSLFVFGPSTVINGVEIEMGVPYLIEGRKPGDYTIYVVEDSTDEQTSVDLELIAISNIAIDPTATEESIVDNSCSGDPDGSVDVSVSGGSGNYLFSLDGGSSFVANPITGLAGGTYEVTVFDEGSHCNEQISITIEDGLTITTTDPPTLCSNDELLELTNYVTPSIVGGTYTFTGEGVTGTSFDPSVIAITGDSAVVTIDVLYEINGCSADGILEIVVKPVPGKPSIGSIDPVCVNGDADPIAITGDSIRIYSDAALTNQVGSGNSFDPETDPAFSTAAPDTVTYYATQQLNGCTSEAESFDIFIIENPATPVITGRTLVCVEESGVEYSVVLTSGSSYSWTVPAGAIITSGASGPDNNVITVDFGSSSGTDTIRVVETTQYGCVSEEGKLSVEVAAQPTSYVFSAIGDTTICEGEPGPELLLRGSETGVSYALRRNPGTFLDTLAGTGAPLNFGNYNVAGTYEVIGFVTGLSGCSTPMDSTVTITVNAIPPPPELAETIDPVCVDGDADPVLLTGDSILIYSDSTLTNQVGSGNSFDPETDPAFSTAAPDTVTYYATQQLNDCTSEALPFDIIIVANPEASFEETALEVCRNESGSLQVNLTGTAPFELSYEVNGIATTVTNIAAIPYEISFDSLQADVTVTLTLVADATTCSQVLSETATITVNPLPTVSLSTFEDVCVDDDAFALFGGTPEGGTYSGPGVDSSTGIFDPSAAGVNTHTITYTYTDGNGCSASDTTTITVNPLPTVSLSTFEDVCVDDDAFALSGGTPEGGTYSGAGVDSSTGIFDPSAAGVDTHDIIYTFTDGNSCVSSDTATITVNPMLAPALTLNVSSTEVCAGDSVVFTAQITNEGADATFNWYLNNVLVADNNQNTYGLVPADGDQVYLEFIQGSLSCGTGDTLTSATEEITVRPMPTATLTEDATICSGESAELTFAFTGTAPFTVEYTDGSQTFTETTMSNPLVISVTPADTTTYTILSITDDFCSQAVSGQSVTITVNEALAPAVEITPIAPRVCEGEEVTFTATPTNPGEAPTYQWYVNDVAVADNNQNTFTYNEPQGSDRVYVELVQGTLACGTGGTATSNVAGVKVDPKPDAGFSGPATVCLAEVPVSYTPNTTGGAFSASVADVISETGVFTPDTAGIYTIYYSITSAEGCSAIDSMDVQVNPVDSISVDLDVNQVQACGETNEFTFTANVTNGGDNPEFSWFVNGTEQAGETTNTFTVNDLAVDSAHEVSVQVIQDSLSMSCPDGGTATDVQSVQVLSSAVATLSTTDETTICAGDTVNLQFHFQGGTQPYELAYTNGTDTILVDNINADSLFISVQPTENQTYSIVSFAEASACTTSFSGEVAITVNTVPEGAPANLQVTTIACSEISVQWDSIANSQGYQVRWSEDPDFVSGVERDTTTATSIDIAGLSGGATYYIEVTAFNGCGAATESAVTSITLPATSEAPANITISEENCNGFTVAWNGVAAAQGYELDLATDSTFANFVDGYNPFSTTDTTEILSGLDPLNYYLRLRTVDSCGISQNSDVLQIDLTRFVIDSLTADITQVACAGDSTGSITVNVHGGVGEFSYLWNTGDTTQLIENQPAGSYWVEVSSPSGCSLRDTFEITEPLPILLEMTKEDVSCFGDSTGTASVSITGGVAGEEIPYAIVWTNSSAEVIDTDTTHIYNLAAGQYFVEVSDANNCVARDTVTISQPEQLTLAATVTDVSCPSDSTGSISLAVSGGTGDYRYVWHTLEVAEDQFFVENLPAGSYPVTVYDALDCSISDTIEINSTNPAVIVDLGPDRCEEETALLDAGYDVADYAIVWNTGDTTQTITVTESGSYDVSVTDRNTGCYGVDMVDVRIGEPLQASVDIVVLEEESCSGSTFAVVANATNEGANPTYQWYLNADSVGTNSDTLRLSSYAEGDTIRVVLMPDASDGCVAAGEESDTLIISLPWMVAPVIDAAQLTVCSDETPAVSAEGENIRWYLNEVSEAAFLNQGASPEYSATGPDTVYLLATQQLGSCVESRADTLELIIQEPVAQPVMPEDITRCGEDELPVVVAEGDSIRWYADAALSLFINEGDTLALTGLNSSDIESTDTVFYAIQSLNGCTSLADSVTITTSPSPVVDLGDDIVRCSVDENGDPTFVVLDAGYNPADGYTIEWIPSGASTQTDTVWSSDSYSVRVTHNASACSVLDEVSVLIADSVDSRVEVRLVNEVSCGTDSLQLEAWVVDHGENPSYSWYLNGVLQPEDTTSTLTLLNYAAGDSVSVAVDVDLACATENPVSDYLIIAMPELAMPTLSVSADTVCEGADNPVFTAGNIIEGANLRWYLDSVADGNLVAEGTDLTYTPEVTAAGTYTYYVTQSTERCGTSEAGSLSFTISAEGDCAPPVCDTTPTAAIVVEPGTLLCPDITTIQLRADTLDVGSNAIFTWYHELVEIGTGVELTYTPAAGFTDGDSIQLEVQIVDEAYICNGVERLTERVAIHIQEEVQATLTIDPIEAVCLDGEGTVTLHASGTYIDWREQGLSSTFRWYVDGVLEKEAALDTEGNEDALQLDINVDSISEGTEISLVVSLDEAVACVLEPDTARYTIPVTQAVTPEVTLSSSAGADGVCAGSEIQFTASSTNAGDNPVYVWFEQPAGGEAIEMQRGLSNTYTYSSAAADDQVWVIVEADASGLCLSSTQDTSEPYVVVLKPEAECEDNGGGVEFDCNVFSVELEQSIEPSCDRNNGYLQYAVTGGASPYTINYSFTETSITEVLSGDTVYVDIENIPANEYIQLSIIDAEGNGCSLDSLSLSMAPRITATLTKPEDGDVTCYGEQMGKARLEISGGNLPVRFKLNGGDWIVSERRTIDFDTLSAGINSVLVEDNEGDQCFGEAEVEILSLYPELEITRFETEQANCNDNTGKIWIREIAGGNGGPYRIKLQSEESFRDFDPEVAFEGLSRGRYTVIVRDGTCEISKEIRVGSPGLIAINYETIPYDCENPGLKAGLYAKIDTALTQVDGPYEASILKRNATGEYVVVPGLEAVRFTQNELYQYGLDNGTYAIEVRTVDREGCPENVSGIVLNDAIMPVPITFSFMPQNIYCAGEVGGVRITDLSGQANNSYTISIYSNETLVKERTIARDEYVVNNGVEGVYEISGLSQGIYRMMVTQEQGGCEGLETSEPVSFKVEKKERMLYAEVVSKTESFPERGSGTLTVSVQTNSGQDPYVASIYLVEPLFPAQSYFSEGDTIQYDPIEASFTHKYEEMPAGVYELYITDANGCSLMIQDTIAHDQRLFIPNVITPNNDGYNEAFYVRNIPPTGTRLIITNRWGKVVYQTQNYNNDWDGGEQPDGVYFYHLFVVGEEGINMKGWVEIRRGGKY